MAEELIDANEDELDALESAKLTPKQRAFLAAFAMTGSLTRAAKASFVSVRSHHRWVEGSEEYGQAFEHSHLEACCRLEEEARRRAVDGQRLLKFGRDGKPLIDPATGEPYIEHRYSDALLMFLLKANNPGKFGDKVEQTHKGGGPLVHVYDPKDPPEVLIYIPDNGRDGPRTAGD